MKKMTKLLLAVVLPMLCLMTTLTSCDPRFKEFSKGPDGIYYRLLYRGDETKICNYEDYVTAHITYLTMEDSVFFAGVRKFNVSKNNFDASIDKCLTMLYEGDSAEFIISAQTFYEKTLETTVPDFLPDNLMKVAVKLLQVETPAEYAKQRERFLNWVKDLGQYEQVLLKQYITDTNIDVPPTEDGIYFIVKEQGSGPNIQSGDTLAIHYEGHYLNGLLFDSTYAREEAFQFVYGEQMQVIGGLEKAIAWMREGDKALIVLPSAEAFGGEGSVGGVVPPFTPVFFEVELLSVKKGEAKEQKD